MGPWRVGWESVKANWLPMVVLWLLAAALVAGYTYVPCVRAALQPVFDFQTGGGWKAAVLNRIVFCGLLPGVFLLSIRSIRPPRPLLTVLANCVWMGAWGVASNAFFTLQTQMFGSGHDIATLAVKVLVDKCVWSTLLCVVPRGMAAQLPASDLPSDPSRRFFRLDSGAVRSIRLSSPAPDPACRLRRRVLVTRRPCLRKTPRIVIFRIARLS